VIRAEFGLNRVGDIRIGRRWGLNRRKPNLGTSVCW